MTDLPIIFSGSMVRALLQGCKTMTRRILKPQPIPFEIDGKECDVTLTHTEGDPRPRVALGRVITRQEIRFAAGDRLWVRENFAYVGTSDPGFLTYQATYPDDLSGIGLENVPPTLKEAGYKWMSCIHMPRKLSRLTLIVSAVKVERLQNISLQDVWAEGCEVRQFWLFGSDGPQRQKIGAAVYGNLWSDLHGRESWDANPFVVAITFHIIKANIDAPEARVAA
jgi:hypothetical protein